MQRLVGGGGGDGDSSHASGLERLKPLDVRVTLIRSMLHSAPSLLRVLRPKLANVAASEGQGPVVFEGIDRPTVPGALA
jgi:hypothetical protein